MNTTDTAFDSAPLVQEVIAQAHIPSATYRLQFHAAFTFQQARARIAYLRALGISDMYASPILQARANSQHGYDVSDPTHLNYELGSSEDFDQMVQTLHDHGMGLLLDTVPNHMGIGDASNVWWMDVLENGPSSVYANFFDISWQPVKPELANKVLLPILEDQYGQVLESGKLQLHYEDGAFWIMYHSLRLPLAPGTYSQVLNYALEPLTEALVNIDDDLLEYQSILTAVGYLPPRTETDPLRMAERNREKEVIKRRIAALYERSAAVRTTLDAATATFNGTVGDPRSFDMLDQLINDQVYRLAFWRVAAEEINYRRFFDINDLAAIRPEDPKVFQATHDFILQLLAEGKANGVRIDHIDGLFDPDGYLWQLQEQYVLRLVQSRIPASEDDSVPDADALAAQVHEQLQQWREADRRRDPARSPEWPLYVVAEKILGEGELLPLGWAGYGTTGYDYLNDLNGIFIDRQNTRAFDQTYSTFIGGSKSFNEMVNDTKKMIMLVSMTSEIYNLSHQLERIAERNRRYRDFTLDTLTFAVREVIAALPVYRTYITDAESVTTRDRRFIEAAVAKAQRRNPRTAASLFQFLRDTLLLRNLDDFGPDSQDEIIGWVRKFQQVSGPVMAKGVEDTAFYRFNRLSSLNEVGGHPDQFGNTVAVFHERNSLNQRTWPHTMLTTSTHDTKRSEDVRVRINVLSEMPDAWSSALAEWSKLNAAHRTELDDETLPDANDEYLLYQTLLGAWPYAPLGGPTNTATAAPLLQPADDTWGEFRERIIAYMQKATKESKQHTSWINADQQYDAALNHFIRCVMDAEKSGPFLQAAEEMAAQIAFHGQINSLAQQLLKLTSPGVPDIYQGTEMWDLSLVDPDNRRPVDYDLRQHLLGEILQRVSEGPQEHAALLDELIATRHDGRIKLYITQRALDFRRTHPALFTAGDYRSLESHGDKAQHVVAFARSTPDDAMLVVVPRLTMALAGDEARLPLGEDAWGDTWLPLPEEMAARRYNNYLTGETVAVETIDGEAGLRLSVVLAQLPVALLVRATSA